MDPLLRVSTTLGPAILIQDRGRVVRPSRLLAVITALLFCSGCAEATWSESDARKALEQAGWSQFTLERDIASTYAPFAGSCEGPAFLASGIDPGGMAANAFVCCGEGWLGGWGIGECRVAHRGHDPTGKTHPERIEAAATPEAPPRSRPRRVAAAQRTRKQSRPAPGRRIAWNATQTTGQRLHKTPCFVATGDA